MDRVFYHVMANVCNAFTNTVIGKLDVVSYATSERQAISNAQYRWKREHGYEPSVKIRLSNVKCEVA